jgi:thiol-disulfide isomerase/thioredoxin
MMRTIRIIAIILVCVLAGVWAIQKFGIAPPVETTSAVKTLPDFTLPDLNDQPRSISEWSGKSLVINFWATWCAPCRREMPLLQSLHDGRTGDTLEIVGVALDNLEDVTRFITEIGVSYPILYGEDNATTAAESFGDDFIGLPFTAFVAPEGEILALRAGELHADELNQLVAELDAVASGERSVAQARERLAN